MAMSWSRLMSGTNMKISRLSISSFSWGHRPRKAGMVAILSLRRIVFCFFRWVMMGLPARRRKVSNWVFRSRGSVNCAE